MNETKGKAIFNKTKIDYLCDTGATRTIISEKAYNKIRTQDSNNSKL